VPRNLAIVVSQISDLKSQPDAVKRAHAVCQAARAPDAEARPAMQRAEGGVPWVLLLRDLKPKRQQH
jgi:hypothetical protein